MQWSVVGAETIWKSLVRKGAMLLELKASHEAGSAPPTAPGP